MGAPAPPPLGGGGGGGGVTTVVVVVVSVAPVSVLVVSVEVVVVSSHVVVKISGGQGVSPPGMSSVGKGDVWYSTSRGVVVVAVTTKVIGGYGI